ncbi:MAG: MBL fold metallo-hydrolase [Methanobrevibacter sp.]|jgi:phosphoribosyl 1,2-cyclic phosphodiesterase|nr:MBL fold metallo-hydrolase [Candidatus Methanoflexus mossambicus]
MRFCTLISGSSGNSSIIMANDTKILIDSGKSGKHIENCLKSLNVNPEEITAILVTHEHTDHSSSVGILHRRYNIPIYATNGTFNQLIGSGKLGKVDSELLKTVESGKNFKIEKISITPFEIPHDSEEPVGYFFKTKKASAVIATDMGYLCENVAETISGADIVLLESNYDYDSLHNGDYPYFLKQRIDGQDGHLSNNDAAKLAVNLANNGTKYIILGHLSKNNNTPELAYNEIAKMLNEAGFVIGKDIILSVANRYDVGDLISI